MTMLPQGATLIITPNRRLAATMHALYQEAQLAEQKSAWETPDILPLTTWIERMWLNYITNSSSCQPLLLNQVQELNLWEEIVLASHHENPLLQVAETAEIAKNAWSLLTQWNVAYTQPLFDSQGDYRYLKKWCQAFDDKCASQHWIAPAALYQILIDLILKSAIALPQDITLIGFTELSPALAKLLDAFKQQGVNINLHQQQADETTAALLAFEEYEEEIVTLARWAKHTHHEHPDKRIGCVIPTLSNSRDRIEQIFQEVFADTPAVINISAGKSLLEYPMINHALQLLAIHLDRLSTSLIELFLQSPFLGDADTERFRRSQLTIALRDKNISTLRIRDNEHIVVTTELAKYLSSCPLLLTRINRLLKNADVSCKNTYRHWAMHFNELLSDLGWPGEKTLVSAEYQVIEQWLKLLDQLASLDFTFAPTTYVDALFTLKKMARSHVFQAKSPETPIQVLGLLEAAGAPFDFLWVSGMDDMSWPPQPKPNPLIPRQIQRELGMPHASAERELRYCQQITTQFKQAADVLLFSYAKKINDIETGVSPILNDTQYMPITTLNLPLYLDPTHHIYTTKRLESLVDQTAPAIDQTGSLSGGIDVIKQQALCPFKAYAKHRLHTKQIDPAQLGLRPKERGIVIHAAMDLLWNTLQSQERLLALSAHELSALIQQVIESALEKIPIHLADNQQFLSIEKQRIYTIINDWLQCEKERQPFSVYAHEQKMNLTINNMTFDIRIDRIDQLANNELLIIDYKTGKSNSIQHWFTARPDDPQLPMYATVDTTNIAGIAFAQLHATGSKFIGLSRTDIEVTGIKPFNKLKDQTALSWNEQVILWKNTIDQLCADFVSGVAYVDPKNKIETCKQCHLASLCRINEASIRI